MAPSAVEVAAAAAAHGYEQLREEQEVAVRALVEGRDVLAVLPTGYGKSAIYQVAGELVDGPTVVVSPLVALQRDQVKSMPEEAAADLSAAVSPAEHERRLEDFERGSIEFLLLAPEQLARRDVLERLRAASPSIFVVDEAHCVSEWGHDFRPDYLRLGEFAAALGRPRILALTATAAPPVRDEIVTRLGLRDPLLLVRGVDRPEIHLAVAAAPAGDDREAVAAERIATAGHPAIAYCATRAAAERVAARLADRGIAAAAYHAGRRKRDRVRVQDAFMAGDLDVVVATIAFGMGVDKPDVRTVVHVHPSASLDAYWQEVGRAARDGESARALLLYHPRDLSGLAFQGAAPRLEPGVVAGLVERLRSSGRPVSRAGLRAVAGLTPARLNLALSELERLGVVERTRRGGIRPTADHRAPAAVAAQVVRRQDEVRAYERSRFEMMRAYAEGSTCRRAFVLGYFGQPFDPPCGACDICDAMQTPSPRADGPFSAGTRVRHATLGLGTVQQVEPDRLIVLFEHRGYTVLDTALVAEGDLLEPVSPGAGRA